MRSAFSRRSRTCLAFARELVHEHEFWVHALAVKGGASAIVAAGIVTASYLVAAPFMLAAAGITLCGGLVALGIYGMVAGSMRSWQHLRQIYAGVTGKPLPPPDAPPKTSWLQRLAARPAVQKWLKNPVVQRMTNSGAWKMARRMTTGQQDNVLGGLAVGGAALSLTLGAVALTTQILVLPVVAIGGLMTFAAVMATSYVVSGISGLYFGIKGVKHMREKKQAAAAAQTATAAQNPESPLTAPAPFLKTAAPDFAKASENQPANDNPAPAATQKPAATAPRPPRTP